MVLWKGNVRAGVALPTVTIIATVDAQGRNYPMLAMPVERPRDIRTLIERNLEELQRFGTCATVARVIRGIYGRLFPKLAKSAKATAGGRTNRIMRRDIATHVSSPLARADEPFTKSSDRISNGLDFRSPPASL